MDHLGIDGTTARHAILTGDPDRVPELLARLGGGRSLTRRRGLPCAQAELADLPLLVVASGIGAPSTAIVVEELAELGVHTLVRLGSCGALRPGIDPGHLVVSTGSVRDEGTSRQYVELAFPAVPDLDLTGALVAALRERDAPFHAGVTHCKDAYYLERPGKQLQPAAVGERWRALREAGVLATEMEASILFVLGSLRRLRTAALFVNVGRTTPPEAFQAALDHAVAAIRKVFETVGPPPGGGGAEGRGTAAPASFLDRPGTGAERT